MCEYRFTSRSDAQSVEDVSITCMLPACAGGFATVSGDLTPVKSFNSHMISLESFHMPSSAYWEGSCLRVLKYAPRGSAGPWWCQRQEPAMEQCRSEALLSQHTWGVTACSSFPDFLIHEHLHCQFLQSYVAPRHLCLWSML